MFSLQQFLGKGDRFFDLLEASSQEARASVEALTKMLANQPASASLDDFVLMRRREKKIAEEISEQLVKTFVTGLEREDIEALSTALYKIPKAVEKFVERYHMAPGQMREIDFLSQTAAVGKAVDTLEKMVKLLRKMPSLEVIKDLNDRLQYVEGEADKTMNQLLRDLYSGRYDPLKTIIAKDLYELLEKIIDRCRDAGNIVTHIILKHS